MNPVTDWRKGTGYPNVDSPLNEWRIEFIKRGEQGLSGVPRFILEDGSVEIFRFPVLHHINDDGSIFDDPQAHRTNATRMIIEFALDEDISYQLSQAERWLKANQSARYSKTKHRVDRYKNYLRLLDAEAEGVSHRVMAQFIFPDIINDYPAFAGSKHVSRSLKEAKRLIVSLRADKLFRK